MELGHHLSLGARKKDHHKLDDFHGYEFKLRALPARALCRACCPTKHRHSSTEFKATVSFNQANTEEYFQKQPELIRKQVLKKQIKIMKLNLKR